MMIGFRKAINILAASALFAVAAICAASCGGGVSRNAKPGALSRAEKSLIRSEGIFRVTTVSDVADSIVLRTPCTDFRLKDLKSPEYQQLAERMVLTVTDPSQDGVGIAGPQVGISRRVVAVIRYDKEGQPFEVYPNIYIEEYSQDKRIGPEGCLSIPDVRADVQRAETIVIRYTNPATLETVRDTISGFTAVIFQHEVDHLDGILFTDRL